MTEGKPKGNACNIYFDCGLSECTYREIEEGDPDNPFFCKHMTDELGCKNSVAKANAMVKIIKQIGLTQILKNEI